MMEAISAESNGGLFDKALEILSCRGRTGGWRATGLTRDVYAQLSEPIVRLAASWQDTEGRIVDPYADPVMSEEFASFTAARFVGAAGFLIGAGRCPDLREICARSLDATCSDLYHSPPDNPIRGAEFYPKELMRGYLALENWADAGRSARWRKHLGEYDPNAKYCQVLSRRRAEDIHNFVTFAVAGEACKKKYGLADNSEFIERHLETQRQRFTELGMYRDPNDPMTYDYTSRMNLSLMMHWGYDGEHAGFVNEKLMRGGITSLFYLSPTGEAPYGGRSNQFHFCEATLAVIFEYEAVRYKALGDDRLAGTFKRCARLAALSTARWLNQSPPRFLKNGFAPELQHGRESGYGLYGVYLLLTASLFGFAHLLADDSIEEYPALFEAGGYILNLPDAFHKVFATCADYHVEIDTRAQRTYDATGLGRVHRGSAPGEIGLSMPVTPEPNYLVSVPASPRGVAIGPGWIRGGTLCWLSDCSEHMHDTEVQILTETPKTVEFSVRYRIGANGCEYVESLYRLDGEGVTVTDTVAGNTDAILVQMPLIKTDGMHHSIITSVPAGFSVDYMGFRYSVQCLDPSGVETFFEPLVAPNRNGIYRVGCFSAIGNTIRYRISITEKEPDHVNKVRDGTRPNCSFANRAAR